MLEGSEIQLLMNLCEQERSQILTILMLSMENPRLAGYMLTGNRSMFFSTDGSLAWLYHCPLMPSPPHVMNQCYDKNPYLLQNCYLPCRLNHPTDLPRCPSSTSFWPEKEPLSIRHGRHSWFIITPTLEHRNCPSVFGPKYVTPVSRRAFAGSGDSGIYTRAQVSEFCDKILISAASRKALQNFPRDFFVPNTAIHGPQQ